MEKKKDGRGGARPGAGRKGSDSKLFAVRLPKRMAEYVESQPSKTEFIKGCIEASLSALPHREGTQSQTIGVDTTVNEKTQHADLSELGEVFRPSFLPMGEDGRRGFIPFFDIGIAAGFPVPLDNDERAQDIDLVRMLCPNPEASYLIRVKGDSMIDAGINSGDIVIVDKSNRNPSESEVAVCEFNGDYTLKHVVRRGTSMFLVPDNPNYPEWEIKEGDRFSVWGTVTYVIHKPSASSPAFPHREGA